MKQSNSQILVADIGGTNARVGIFVASEITQSTPPVLNIQHYLCNDYQSLEDILLTYIEQHSDGPMSTLALAVAGHEIEDTIVGVNLPWQCAVDTLKQKLGLHNVYVLNDFAATAYATMFLNPDHIIKLDNNQAPETEETVMALGPGTGFGCSIQPPGINNKPLCTEAGHMGFAAGNDLEFELVNVLRSSFGRVTIEDLLSGPGIKNIYSALCEIEGKSEEKFGADQICKHANAGSDPLCTRSMGTFFSILGSVMADLALAYNPRDGIYLAGGILPKNRELLMQSNFLTRFVEKDMLYGFLRQIPITLITYAYTGMLGAAVWASSRQQQFKNYS